MNKCGNGQIHGFSAGSHPNGKVNPLALELLEQLDFPIEGLRSKRGDEFAAPTGTHFDFVVEKKFAFRQAFKAMETRIKLFLSLPIASIDKMRAQERMDAIGKMPLEAPQK